MLSDFLIANRTDIISHCKSKVAARNFHNLDAKAMEDGVAVFFDQVVSALQVGRIPEPASPVLLDSLSAPPGGVRPFMSVMGESAARHGRALMYGGFTVDQVVHGYGDVCQAITELAFQADFIVRPDDFQILNSCLDNAIADAVTEYAYHHDASIVASTTEAFNTRLGMLAHEMRNLIHTACLSLNAVRTG